MGRAPLVVVVGICASGKSTLVEGLREKGFSALEIGQEHSSVPYLWARSDPTFLVYLHIPNQLAQERRPYLTDEKLRQERRFLSYARSRADLVVDATEKDVPTVRDEVVQALEAADVGRIFWEPERPFENWGE